MDDKETQNIDALPQELRVIPPPDDFRADAVVADEEIHGRAAEDPLAFWGEQAGTLDWFRPWDDVMDW